jgi:hypothetical protein
MLFSPEDLKENLFPNGMLMGAAVMRFAFNGTFHSENGGPDRTISVSFEQGKGQAPGSFVLNGKLYDSYF